MLFLILLWFILRFISLKINNKIIDPKKEFIINCFAMYTILLIRVTLLPITLNISSYTINLKYLPINAIPIIPLVDNILPLNLSHIFLIIKNTIGNIILFLPFGSIAPFIFKKLDNLKSIFIISIIISCSIEILQLFEYIFSISENTRITDINDIILNVLGALIGFLIYKKRLKNKINL